MRILRKCHEALPDYDGDDAYRAAIKLGDDAYRATRKRCHCQEQVAGECTHDDFYPWRKIEDC